MQWVVHHDTSLSSMDVHGGANLMKFYARIELALERKSSPYHPEKLRLTNKLHGWFLFWTCWRPSHWEAPDMSGSVRNLNEDQSWRWSFSKQITAMIGPAKSPRAQPVETQSLGCLIPVVLSWKLLFSKKLTWKDDKIIYQKERKYSQWDLAQW